MSDTAVHLEKFVLPEVPVRHWICTFPWGVRAVLGYDKELCAEAVSAFVRELSRSLKRRAKKLFNLASVAEAHTGAVAALQRTDSSLRLNVHLHVLALDGVYVREANGTLVFHALPTPTQHEVSEVVRCTARRLKAVFKAHGRSSPWDEEESSDDDPEPFSLTEPGLFACYGAAARGVAVSGEHAGKPVMRLLVNRPPARASNINTDKPAAEVLGVNVHAVQRVDGRDRRQLERLARYITRPPLSQERLTRRSDGRLELALKSVWKNGTSALLLTPDAQLVRLCAAVPRPTMHLLRYFGVLSSHSSYRAEVVPEPAAEPGMFKAEPAVGDQLALPMPGKGGGGGGLFAGADEDRPAWRGRTRWGWLIRHVFREDVDRCEKCQGPMRWVEAATTEEAITRVLAKHGLRRHRGPRRFLWDSCGCRSRSWLDTSPAEAGPTVGQVRASLA
jgi:hypothetical protein